MSQLKYWVWLSMRFGVRPKVKLALVEHFGTPQYLPVKDRADVIADLKKRAKSAGTCLLYTSDAADE